MGRTEHPLSGPEGPPVNGVDRRDFMKVCMMAAAAVGLPASVGRRWAEAAEAGLKPVVIWLHFQECTGCTESLLRTSYPGIGELILDLVSLDYHETLFAAAGHQIEDGHLEGDVLLRAADARCADPDRPDVRDLVEVPRGARRVGHRPLAAELVQAVAVAMTVVAKLLGTAPGVVVGTPRTVLVDGPTVCEKWSVLIVQCRQCAHAHELEHGAQEVIGIGRASRDAHHGLVGENVLRAHRAGVIGIGRGDTSPRRSRTD